jgi:hypothetical protein
MVSSISKRQAMADIKVFLLVIFPGEDSQDLGKC